MEIQCLEWRLIAAPPSLLAAAAVWLSRIVLGFADWVSSAKLGRNIFCFWLTFFTLFR